jgi:hypothetical protein
MHEMLFTHIESDRLDYILCAMQQKRYLVCEKKYLHVDTLWFRLISLSTFSFQSSQISG